MKIKVQRKVNIWIEESYNIENKSQIQDAIDYDLDCYNIETLWETQEDLGPVEVFDENWNSIYNNYENN
jgi:hypothetical protein